MAKKKKPTAKPTFTEAVKDILSPAAPARRSRGSRSQITALKNVGAVIALLLIACAIVSAIGGERRDDAGELTAGAVCRTDNECIRGHLCFSGRNESPRCTQLCSQRSTCPPGSTCTTRAIPGKKGHMKFKDLCIQDD